MLLLEMARSLIILGVKKLHITHLYFANDLVVFLSATSTSLLGVKAVLDDFYEVSGLSVSYGKSEFICCGVTNDLKAQLADIVGLKLGSLPVKYLGVPLSCKKLSRVECQSLLDKITSRITSRIARLLSYVGRLQLIEFVLASLYGYW